MADLEQILLLWRDLEASGTDYVLATVIAVEGPNYRKPGACMLIAQDGRRAGTVSGGCLEDEVARRAFWLTLDGPTVRRYTTAGEGDDRPYGSGCGGIVWLLLERRLTARRLLSVLADCFRLRIPLAVATNLGGEQLGRRAFAGLNQSSLTRTRPATELDSDRGNLLDHIGESLQDLAERALARAASMEGEISVLGGKLRVWINFRPARNGLLIIGAGDDAQPLLRLAKTLGWFVIVADGRSQLVTRERFPLADELHVLTVNEMGANRSAGLSVLANLHSQDAAVVMTHSFEQDARILASLLSVETPLAYIGVLGPQRRTRELLTEAARLLDFRSDPNSSNTATVERWLGELHTPTGLDLGAEAPETIALSIIAEIQKSFARATALPLSEVRGDTMAVSRKTGFKPNRTRSA
ncbi:MAG: XdhC family protein [Terracidiphilus sp.]|jgi:xanthine/CO dehydrogenase XdhC/CoxF family maturation factor